MNFCLHAHNTAFSQVLTLQHQLALTMYQGTVTSVNEQSDKKHIERYDNDSVSVHHWLSIYFIKEKSNYHVLSMQH